MGQADNTGASGIATDSIHNYKDVDVKPTFKGGVQQFYDFIGKNFKVPAVKNLRGKVIVEFIIEKDGALTNLKVVREVGHGTGKEAIRVLSKCPKWIPATHQGFPVRVRYNFPINLTSH